MTSGKCVKIIAFFLVGFVFCAQSEIANPDEWPILHNVNHTGFSPTALLRPPLKLKWAVRVPACFKAGPVVADSLVVLQSRDGYVFCLDANTGAMKWRYFVNYVDGHTLNQKDLPFTETGPCVWNGRVYAAFHSVGAPGVTGMRCFDLENGELLWKKDVGCTAHRIHYSPQISNGRLFYCSNRETTGKTYQQANYSAANLNYEAQVQAWDAMTGDTIWTYTMWPQSCQNTTLLVVNDTVFVSVGVKNGVDSGRTVAFDINGSVLWSSSQYFVSGYLGNMQYHDGKLMVLSARYPLAQLYLDPTNGNFLYGGKGIAYSKISAIMNGRYYNRGYGQWALPYSITTGENLPASNWGDTGSSAYSYSGCGAPVTGNGFIYNVFGGSCFRTGGAIAAPEAPMRHTIAATDESGKMVWSFQNTSHNCPSVAIAYNRLYAVSGTEGMIYCFENE